MGAFGKCSKDSDKSILKPLPLISFSTLYGSSLVLIHHSSGRLCSKQPRLGIQQHVGWFAEFAQGLDRAVLPASLADFRKC